MFSVAQIDLEERLNRAHFYIQSATHTNSDFPFLTFHTELY
jgi:hypothetical protein